MAGNADLQRKLNQGVEAAKAGNRSAARRLLEEVVEQDERNEVAWIWLASLATGAAEKREHLRRVLAINPQNKLAREALSRLGETIDVLEAVLRRVRELSSELRTANLDEPGSVKDRLLDQPAVNI